jgi:ech hydrogenase subunit D
MTEPKNVMTVIDKEQLLESVMAMKTKGFRLSQACASYKDGKYNLSYSFADDTTYYYETLRVVIDKDETIPSISEFYAYADFYENEMKELFGVKIQMIKHDYHNKLYRIEAETPFLPKDADDKEED